MTQMNGSSNSSNLIHSTHTHTHTPQCQHTHHKATCSKLTPTNPLQTVPHTAHKMRHRLKINGVTSIELMCEECFQEQGKQKINM